MLRRRPLLPAALLLALSAGLAAAPTASGGRPSLVVSLRGEVVELSASEVSVDAGADLGVWHCDRRGIDQRGLAIGDRAKLRCRSAQGRLVATRLRPTADADVLSVAARAPVTALTGSTIAVDPGRDLPTVACAITRRTRMRGAVDIGRVARVSCRSRQGALVARKVRAAVVAPGESPPPDEPPATPPPDPPA